MAKIVCPKCNMENIDDSVFCDNCGNSLELNKNSEEVENHGSEMPTTTWKIINSWWILLTLPFGLLTWISYLYAGYTANNKKWSYLGLSYIAYWFLFLISLSIFPSNNVIYGIVSISMFIIWIFGIGYAIKIRNEYLIRLEVNNKIRKEKKAKKEKTFRKELENM